MGKLANQSFGPFRGGFSCGYNRFLRTRRLIPNRRHSRSRSRRSGVGNFASKSFGSFGGTFSCGENSFLRTRYDALTRHTSLSRPEDTQKHRTRDN
jgi:hypothetical protein